jgi:hypothetical protein
MTPDVFLSQHRLRTDGYGGLTKNADPGTYVNSLKALNATRTLDKTGNLSETLYVTPGLTPGSIGPADWSPVMIGRLTDAMDNYRSALKTGDLAQAHEAQDEVNLLRTVLGYGPLPWLTDFGILAEGDTPVGELARLIYSERLADGGQGTFAGSPIPWFDTAEAFQALAQYQVPAGWGTTVQTSSGKIAVAG